MGRFSCISYCFCNIFNIVHSANVQPGDWCNVENSIYFRGHSSALERIFTIGFFMKPFIKNCQNSILKFLDNVHIYIPYQLGSYSFYIGDAVLYVEKFAFPCKMGNSFWCLLKIEIIGAALQQDLIISQIFGAALQQLQHR